MSHRPAQSIHAYKNRGLDLRLDVDTALDSEDFTDITFRTVGIVKTGLTAEAGGMGVTIDFTLTAAELDISPDTYRWECLATVAGEVRTIAQGFFTVDSEPTEEEPS